MVPVHADDRGRNPVLLRRAAFPLVEESSGDRGLGPVIADHPELVDEVAVEGTNPDVDTPGDLAATVEAWWGARVRANREQVDVVREVPDGSDFYAPVNSLFRADPTRTDDPLLDALLDLVHPGDTWIDVGAGAGRFALPIARALDESGGEVIALDASPSMLEGLREIAEDYAIENVRTIEARWPPENGASRGLIGDVALIAHVGYDIEAIGPFLDAFEASADRICVAVLMERVPASAADPFWPPVHGDGAGRPAGPARRDRAARSARSAAVGDTDRARAPPVRIARRPRGVRPSSAMDRSVREEGGAVPGCPRRASRSRMAAGGRSAAAARRRSAS